MKGNSETDVKSLQIVDVEGNYVGNVNRWVETMKLQNLAFDYSVVSVLGSQSSGKSTLLNHLFGTSFQVMDSHMGHSQTTKGIWIGSSTLDGCTDILLDIEGNDSRERGDRRLTFEHRAALFALAISDCVVINLWYISLGNYTASSFGMLKTVMEVNMELFLQEPNFPKTLLLFVVRDWSESMTPLALVELKIQQEYIQNIWLSINKPPRYENSKPSDFFDFAVFGLPHAVMSPNEFDIGIGVLRERWLKSFRNRSYSRGIPIDGLGVYCANLWKTISGQSQLDIPSQKEMLSSFRCQEIKAHVFLQLAPQIANKTTSNDVRNPEEWILSILNEAADKYFETGRRYEKHICEKFGDELIDQLLFEIRKTIEVFSSHKQKELANKFVSGLTEKYGSVNMSEDDQILRNVWEDFNKNCVEMKDLTIENFEKWAERFQTSVQLPWYDATDTKNFNLQPTELILSCAKDISRVRDRQMIFFKNFLQRRIVQSLDGLQDLLISKHYDHQNFVYESEKLLLSIKQTIYQEYLNCYIGISENDEGESDEVAFSDLCGFHLLTEYTNQLKSIARGIHHIIMDRFDIFFNSDEDFQPRQWSQISAEKLKNIFNISKTKSLAVLESVSNNGLNLSLFVTPAMLQGNKSLTEPILFQGKIDGIKNRAIRSMQAVCRDAQFVQSTGGKISWRTVPMWLWIVLFAFAWNEIWGTVGIIFFHPLITLFLFPTIFIICVTMVLLKGRTIIHLLSFFGVTPTSVVDKFIHRITKLTERTVKLGSSPPGKETIVIDDDITDKRK